MPAVGYLNFTSQATDNSAETADKAQLDITGRLEVIAALRTPPSLTAGGLTYITGKRGNAGQRSWNWGFRANSNDMTFTWSTDGTAETTINGSDLPAALDNTDLWVRVEFNPNDGANRTLKFWYSLNSIDTAGDPRSTVTWTQVGATSTSTTTTLFAGAASLLVGARNTGAGTGQNYLGRIYAEWVYDNTTLVADPDFRDDDDGWSSPPGNDGLGNDWALRASAVWVPPLAAPGNPAATTISSTEIDVSWDDVANETGYRVERSLTGVGGWSDVSGNLAAGTVLYSDTGLTPDTQYFYRVFAFNADGDSPASATVDATTDNIAPVAPTNPAAVALSQTAIQVTWDDIPNETGYRVERSLTGVGGWSNVSGSLAAGSTSYGDTGLTPSTTYFYRIFAFNLIGDSPASSTVSATTFAAPPAGGGNRMGGTGAIRKPPR